MTSASSLWKVNAHWARQFTCLMDALVEPHISVLPQALADWYGAFFWRRGETCVIRIPNSLLDYVRDAVHHECVDTVFSPRYAQTLFGDMVGEVIGPAWLGYADAGDFQPADLHHVRDLEAGDRGELNALAEENATEWQAGGIGTNDDPLVGAFEGDILVSVGSAAPSSASILNVGIVTRRQRRGRGYGTSVASRLTRCGLDRGAVMQYRTLESNKPSMAIAHRLGYREYGSTMAVRLVAPGGRKPSL